MADQSKIGLLAAALMEQIEQDLGTEIEVGDVVLIAEVINTQTGVSTITVRGTNARTHTMLGLLEMARRIATGG